MRSAYTIFVSAWLWTLPHAAATAATLAPDQINKLFSGTTIESQDRTNRLVELSFSADGSLSRKVVSGSYLAMSVLASSKSAWYRPNITCMSS